MASQFSWRAWRTLRETSLEPLGESHGALNGWNGWTHNLEAEEFGNDTAIGRLQRGSQRRHGPHWGHVDHRMKHFDAIMIGTGHAGLCNAVCGCGRIVGKEGFP
jgi:hypothetical protein